MLYTEFASDFGVNMGKEQRNTQTVFIINDNLSDLKSLTYKIESNSLETKSFSCTEDFLADYHNQPGCLILDISKPKITKFALFELLKNRGYALPIIYLIEQEDFEITVQRVKNSTFKILTKPIDHNELITAIKAALTTDQKNRRTLNN